MVAELVWLEQAEADLDAVAEYISEVSPDAAKQYVSSILTACDQLTAFPHSGRRYNKRYRVLVVRNHLVFYRQDDSGKHVIVAGVVDGRRDLAKLVKTLPEREK